MSVETKHNDNTIISYSIFSGGVMELWVGVYNRRVKKKHESSDLILMLTAAAVL